MKKIILSLIALGVLAAGYGYYLYNKPVEGAVNKKADVTITATQLVSDYEADETKANAAYLGKVVEVNGKVAQVTQEEGKTKIHLESESPMSAVICEMQQPEGSASIKAGDEIKIKGQCTGYLSDVILVGSAIVQ